MDTLKLTAAVHVRAATVALVVGIGCAVLMACGGDDTEQTTAPGGSAGASGDASEDSAHDASQGGGGGANDAWSDSAGKAGSAGKGGSPIADGGADAERETAPSGLTTCVSVAHIGDSLTYYTEPSLTAAYALVGATAQINAYGGRAILQKLPDDPMTGKQAAISMGAGFAGCWVIALGTNDTANVAAGASYTRADAIDQMMTAIDPTSSARVMWVNTFTTKTSGYWSNANMQLWNQALTDAQNRWPNMLVYDWASVAETGTAPFADGIHHTTAGYEVRNAAIAHALAGFFPAP